MNCTTTLATSHVYFAYGSNLDPHQMGDRCPGAIPVGTATLRGWRFQINDRGVATVVPDENNEVLGGLWQVTEDHLVKLDAFEGVGQDLYARHQLTVMTERGMVEAVIYIESGTATGEARPGYLQRVCRGARWFGLDDAYCETLAEGGPR